MRPCSRSLNEIRLFDNHSEEITMNLTAMIGNESERPPDWRPTLQHRWCSPGGRMPG
jgi:hypothetical protein